MRTPRVYIDKKLTVGSTIELPKEIILYLGQVLKKKMGNDIILFNGQIEEDNNCGEYLAEITNLSKHRATAVIKEFIIKSTKANICLELAQCISKPNHFEVTLQKAVELGVNIITPIISERSEQIIKSDNIANKMARWQKIVISACEQCGRTDVPTLNNPIEIYDWVDALNTHDKQLLLTLCTKTDNSLHDINFSNAAFDNIKIIIGPEGGIASSEINLLEQTGFTLVKLGNRIMRTETAGIASLAIVQYLSNNL